MSGINKDHLGGRRTLEDDRNNATLAAETAVQQFINSQSAITFDLQQDFGFGVKASDVVEQGRLIGETPPLEYGEERKAGARWTEIYSTRWSGIVKVQEFFKRPGDEFNVEAGGAKLVKRK